jgi:hypothetical protein
MEPTLPASTPLPARNPSDHRLIPALLRGDSDVLAPLILKPGAAFWITLLGVVVLGAGAYGVAVGSWRGGWQPLFTGLKLPGILLLTAAGNAGLNAALAPLLGLNLHFRQSLAAVLASFAISAVILGAAAPIVGFQLFNLPGIDADWSARGRSFDTVQATQVLVIAFAGIAGTVRLLQLLETLAGSEAVAKRVLVGWLAGNFLLGTQITWILRPYFGSHALPVEFLREHPLQGNFFETIWHSTQQLLFR